MGSSGRDILRAVGRVTESNGEAPKTTAMPGWAAGGVLGGLGLAAAAGLYFASQSAPEKGDSPEPAASAADPEAYFAIPDGKTEILLVSDAQKQCIKSLLNDDKLNAAGELTRASDGSSQVRGVLRWRGDEGAWIIARTALSDPESIIVRTHGARKGDRSTLQAIAISQAKVTLTELQQTENPLLIAGIYAVRADNTAQNAVAYRLESEHEVKAAQVSKDFQSATSFLYQENGTTKDIVKMSTGEIDNAARTIIAPRIGSDRGWFETMFGFSDYADDHLSTDSNATFLSHGDKFEYDAGTGKLTLKSNGRTWQAGTFTLPTLAELRTSTKQKLDKLNAAKQKATSAVRLVTGDASMLHGDPRYARAVFQAASQFNCLESGPEYTPEKGVSAYAEEPTQGRECAISCAPGTIVRAYFALNGGPQTEDNQINTIEDLVGQLGEKAIVKNGYTAPPDAKILQKLNDKIPAQASKWENLTGAVRLGVQADTEVTCTKTRDGGEWVQAHGIQVTQVYAGAVSVPPVPPELHKEHGWTRFARLVLRAAYEAPLHVALENGAHTVVLTSFGWGNLGAESQALGRWVAEAIEEAVKLFKNAGLEIMINVKDDDVSEEVAQNLKSKGILTDGSQQPTRNSAFGAWPHPIEMYTE